MNDYVQSIRENWRKEFNVIEVNDLPLVLLTEAVNQAILRGATKVEVTCDGKVVCVKDNSAPWSDDELDWMLRLPSEGIMSPERRRMFRILDRQWPPRVLLTLCALSSEFKVLSSRGQRMKSVVFHDGEPVSDTEVGLGIGDGNMVVMRPFLEIPPDHRPVYSDLVEAIGDRFPLVEFTYKGI